MADAAKSRNRRTRRAGVPRSGASELRAAKDALVRRHILESAEPVFAEHGFAGARMQAVASRAGVSLATLYQYHPGKRELHRAVLLERDREMMAAVMSHPALGSGRPLDVRAVLAMLEGHLRFLLSHPDYLKMILQEGHAWYHAAAQPTADEQALWEQGLSLMTAVFRQGMDAGELIPAEPADQARLLMALQQARLASWVADGMRDGHDAVIARIQADFVRQFCLPALARTLLSDDGGALRAGLDLPRA